MNIGFFGDSYVDLWDKRFFKNKEDTPWCKQLYEELNSTFICSGKGGFNQYYAIDRWNFVTENNFPIDVAIFTFTWDFRFYNENQDIRAFLASYHEKRMVDNLTNDEKDLLLAIDGYWKYLHSPAQTRFIHELMIKHILELPSQHKDIKFIFLPNNTYSQELAKKHFTQGILLDFAFEKITELEGEDVLNPDHSKVNHLYPENHNKFKNIIKNILLEYELYRNKIYPIDYKQFRI